MFSLEKGAKINFCFKEMAATDVSLQQLIGKKNKENNALPKLWFC